MITANSVKNELQELEESFSNMTQNSKIILKSGSLVNPIGDLISQIDVFNYTRRDIMEGRDIILRLIDNLPNERRVKDILGEKENAKEKINTLFINLMQNRNNIAASPREDKRKKEYMQLLKGFRLIADVLSTSNLPPDVLASNLLSIKESSNHCSQNWKHTLISFMVMFRDSIAKKIGYNIKGDELDELKMRYLELFYKAKYDVVNNLIYQFKLEQNVYSSYDPHYKEICTNYLNKKYKLNLPQLENVPDNYIRNNDRVANSICEKFARYLSDKSIHEAIYDKVCDYARVDAKVMKYLKDWFVYYVNKNGLKYIATDRKTMEDFLYEKLLKGHCKNKLAYVAIREMLKSYDFIKIEKSNTRCFNRLAMKQRLLDIDIEDEDSKIKLAHQLNKLLQSDILKVIEFMAEYEQYNLLKYVDANKIKNMGRFLTKLYNHNNINAVTFLIKKGADVNVKNEYEETLLWYIIRNKNMNLLKLLLKNKANVNIRNRYGDTPLWYAIKTQDRYLVKLLIKNGANINKLNKNRENILSYVIENKNKEMVRYLVSHGANLNVISRYGRTVFWHVAMYQDINMAKFLIKNGLNINLKDKYGETALWYTVGFRKIRLTKLLLNAGAYTETMDKNGITILSYAILSGDTRAARLLIRNGANVNKIDNNDGTALWYAVKKNNINIIKLLLEYGADMEVRDREGDKMLCYIVKNRDIEVLQLFINRGVNLNGIDRYGKTALWYAVRSNLTEFVKLLVSNGADIIDEYKDTVLWYGVKCKNVQLIKTILDNSVNLDINKINRYGKTALWYAVKNKNIEAMNLLINKGARKMGIKREEIFWFAIKNRNRNIVNLLIKHGIDVNEKNTYGENALWYVVKNKDVELTKLLIDKGIDINLKNRYGKTALWYAINNQSKEIMRAIEEALEQQDIVSDKRNNKIEIPLVEMGKKYITNRELM